MRKEEEQKKITNFFFQYLLKGHEAIVEIDGKLYNLKTNAVLPKEGYSPGLFYTRQKNNNLPILLEVSTQDSVLNCTSFKLNRFLKKQDFNGINSFQNVNVKVSNAENGESLLSFSTNYPSHLDAARVIDASCKTNKKSDFVCRLVLSTDNGAVVQLQSGKEKLPQCSILTI